MDLVGNGFRLRSVDGKLGLARLIKISNMSTFWVLANVPLQTLSCVLTWVLSSIVCSVKSISGIGFFSCTARSRCAVSILTLNYVLNWAKSWNQVAQVLEPWAFG